MNKLQCPICKNKIGYNVIKKHYSLCKQKYLKRYTEEKQKYDDLQQKKNKYDKLHDLINSTRNENPINKSNRTPIEREPPKREPPKREPPKREPPKREPPKREPPKREPPKRDTSMVLINNTKNKLIKYNINLYYLYTHSGINLKYENVFNKFLYNKSVVLVGPASTLYRSKSGNIINSFDIVVRLNKSLPLPVRRFEDIGNRTDILYNSLNTTDFPGENIVSEKLYIKNNIKFLCCPYPNRKPFNSDIRYYLDKSRGVIPFKIMSDTTFNNIQNIIGTRPNTGLCAIMDLLKTDLKYLYITGINFYKTMYYKEYRNTSNNDIQGGNSQIHNQEPQIKLLRYLSLIDDRIILDKDLNFILYKEYRHFFKVKYKMDSILIDSFVNKKGSNIFHKLKKYSNIIFVGSGNDIIDVSSYDIVICYSMKNIKNYNNKNIICFEYDNTFAYSSSFKIIGVVNINSQTILSDTPVYNISKNYYVNINRALTILDVNMSLDMFIVLSLVRYCKIKVINLNIVNKSPNYLLYKYMKQKNMIM